MSRHSALYSNIGISFWGGIHPETGKVIDTTHPLHNQSVADKILVIPSGRGSCTGSQVLLELILNGRAPRALILRDVDVILCTGAIVAEEFFGSESDGNVPIICAVGEEKFNELIDDGDEVLTLLVEKNDDGEDVVQIVSKRGRFAATNLLTKKDTLELDKDEVATIMNSTNNSKAAQLALKTVRRVASISGATTLMPISCAHIDAVTYIGPGGLRFAQKLSQLNGKVAVPTTLNSQSTDRRQWQALGVDVSHANYANSVGDAYLALGCEMSFTCAPYLLPNAPSKGDNIMWGESNAVVYSNSVIGARTEKYPDYFDILAAIVGRVPNIGVHVNENRVPTILIDARQLISEQLLQSIYKGSGKEVHDMDSFFPAMGWLIGNLSDGRIPLILGFDTLPSLTADNLKAFSAAFGTTGTAPMYHMSNVTPESMGDDAQRFLQHCGDRHVLVTKEDLRRAYQTLDSGRDENDNNEVNLVAVGNPHLSIDELKRLSEMIECDDRPKVGNVQVIGTLGRYVHSEGIKYGYVQKLESFGFQLINDTCWCMLLDPPIIPVNVNAKILTNSGKYAHYGPGLTNRRIRFGSMYDCVEAAKSGRMRSSGSIPQWLRSFSGWAVRSLKK
eukprot:scaffold5559_cov207-Alexandrium_tamarense.AAC.2